MNAKNKGRPLPALLPLQYCSVSRAARMLECEEEDIYHWHEIMAIELRVQVPTQDCHLSFIYSGNLDSIDEALKFDLLNNLEKHLKPLESIQYGSSPYLIPLNDIDIDPETKKYEFIAGITKLSWFWPEEKEPDLVVCRSDLEKIHFSIVSGEPLELNRRDVESDNSFSNHINELRKEKPKERLTPGISKAVLALTDLALRLAGEDPYLINNPHKLHSRINELLLKHKANPDGGFDLGISDNAYRDILSKGKSSIATEKS